jgi:hypothetical protein
MEKVYITKKSLGDSEGSTSRDIDTKKMFQINILAAALGFQCEPLL